MNPDRAVYCIRQGERSFQLFSTSAAQAVDLSVWHRVQALGIFSVSVSAGVMKWKVWLHVDVGDRLLDLRHVAGDALAARAVRGL